MTAPNPLDGIGIPYALTVAPAAGSYNITNFLLSPGTALIRVVWDGKEAIRARVERTIGGQEKSTKYVEIIPSSPETGNMRASLPIEVAVGQEPTQVRLQSTVPISQETVDAAVRCGITVIPTLEAP